MIGVSSRAWITSEGGDCEGLTPIASLVVGLLVDSIDSEGLLTSADGGASVIAAVFETLTTLVIFLLVLRLGASDSGRLVNGAVGAISSLTTYSSRLDFTPA